MTSTQCRNPVCEHEHALISWMDVYCCMPCRVAHRIHAAAAPTDTDDSATDIGDYAATAPLVQAPAIADEDRGFLSPLSGSRSPVREITLGQFQDFLVAAGPDPIPRPGWLARLLRRLFG